MIDTHVLGLGGVQSGARSMSWKIRQRMMSPILLPTACNMTNRAVFNTLPASDRESCSRLRDARR